MKIHQVSIILLLSFFNSGKSSTAFAEKAPNEKVAALPQMKLRASDQESENEQLKVEMSSLNSGKVFGLLDIRPSMSIKSSVLGSENTLEGGYQFNPNTRLTYTQWWNTTKGLYEGIYAHDGFFRLRLNNLYSNGPFSLNYQGRLFLPTYSVRRVAGFVGALFNQVQMVYQINPNLNFSFSVSPIYQHFSQTSFNGKINSYFQNQTVANLDVKLSSQLLLSVPVYLISTKNHSDFGVTGSGAWSHLLIIWPELGFSLNDSNTVGISYYSDNLMTSSLDNFNIGNGLSNGNLQVFWTARL